MDVKLMNPFISAASEVLEKEIGVHPSEEKISVQKSAHTTERLPYWFA